MIGQLHQWNIPDEQLASRLVRDLESNLSEELKGISRFGIRLANNRIQRRLAAVHEVIHSDMEI
jgi:hypothetical protein